MNPSWSFKIVQTSVFTFENQGVRFSHRFTSQCCWTWIPAVAAWEQVCGTERKQQTGI